MAARITSLLVSVCILCSLASGKPKTELLNETTRTVYGYKLVGNLNKFPFTAELVNALNKRTLKQQLATFYYSYIEPTCSNGKMCQNGGQCYTQKSSQTELCACKTVTIISGTKIRRQRFYGTNCASSKQHEESFHIGSLPTPITGLGPEMAEFDDIADFAYEDYPTNAGGRISSWDKMIDTEHYLFTSTRQPDIAISELSEICILPSNQRVLTYHDVDSLKSQLQSSSSTYANIVLPYAKDMDARYINELVTALRQVSQYNIRVALRLTEDPLVNVEIYKKISQFMEPDARQIKFYIPSRLYFNRQLNQCIDMIEAAAILALDGTF